MQGTLTGRPEVRWAAAALAAVLACLLASAPAGAAPWTGQVLKMRDGVPFPMPYAGVQVRAVASAQACANADLAPNGGNVGAIASATLCLVNAERSERNRRPLSANARLARAGRGHVADMVEHSYFSHDGRDGSTFSDRIRATGYLAGAKEWLVGENLAWGTGALATPEEIVRAWMRSAGHRANILDPDYREIGVGVVTGNPSRSNGRGATFATEFGFVARRAARRSSAPSRAAALALRSR